MTRRLMPISWWYVGYRDGYMAVNVLPDRLAGADPQEQNAYADGLKEGRTARFNEQLNHMLLDRAEAPCNALLTC